MTNNRDVGFIVFLFKLSYVIFVAMKALAFSGYLVCFLTREECQHYRTSGLFKPIARLSTSKTKMRCIIVYLATLDRRGAAVQLMISSDCKKFKNSNIILYQFFFFFYTMTLNLKLYH